MPGVVAGLGSLAGGMLGKLISPEKKALKTDSNILGITNANLGKSPSTGLDVNVAQVNPTPALNYFQQAADVSKQYYQQGLSLYQTSIDQAKSEIRNSYKEANKQLAPLSTGGMAAFNEMLRYMGIDPLSPTSDLSSEISGVSPELAQQIQEADQIRDPNLRAKYKEQIINGGNALIQSMQSNFNEPPPQIYQAKPWGANSGAFDEARSSGDRSKIIPKAQWDAQEQAKVQASQQALADWQARKDAAAANVTAQQQQISSTLDQFQKNYTDNYDAGYTGAQATEKLRQTPGYQFAFNQGKEAVERAASARGNLMSGNTLAAVTEYGQNMGDQLFQQTLNNLGSIATVGLPATQQIAQNTIGEGANIANLDTLSGSAAVNTYNQIGNQYANAYTNQGQGLLQASIFNAGEQNKAMFQDRQNASAERQQAMASGPSYMNAATAQNQFNYGVFQNQQAGNAYVNAAANAANNSKIFL